MIRKYLVLEYIFIHDIITLYTYNHIFFINYKYFHKMGELSVE